MATEEDNKQVSSVIHKVSFGLSPGLAKGLSAPTAHTGAPTPAVLLELELQKILRHCQAKSVSSF